MPNVIYTVGHSNLAAEAFLDLLRGAGINAIADVRSAPYSRYNPQFDREAIKASLRSAGIQYVYLGKELGARSDDPACYLYGKVQYQKLAATPLFQQGLARVLEGAAEFNLALLCAEKDPLDCHRSILVSRRLLALGAPVHHLHSDGRIETHQDAMIRLAEQLHLRTPEQHLFRTDADLLEDAYRLQENKIAYDSSAAA